MCQVLENLLFQCKSSTSRPSVREEAATALWILAQAGPRVFAGRFMSRRKDGGYKWLRTCDEVGFLYLFVL